MSEFITPKIDTPQRNLTSELAQIFNANQRYAQPYYDLEAKYGPKYNQLALGNLGDQTLGFDDADGVHHPGTIELGRAGTQVQRETDLQDVENLGPRERAAYFDNNPWLRDSLDQLHARMADTPILRDLNSQAEAGLASGGALTPDDERQIRESSRGAFADLGIEHGDQAALGEVLNRDAAKRSRMAAATQQAATVQGLNQQQNDFVGRATQIDSTALNDLWAAILGRSSGGPGGGGASLTPIGTGSRVFDPYNPYAQDLFNTNLNATANIGIANSNAQAATRAAIASIAGAGIAASDIRLKENIVQVGESPSGIPIYEFNYRAGCVPKHLRPVRYRGTMADDVETVRPDAVLVDPATGFKMVNYDLIDVELEEAA